MSLPRSLRSLISTALVMALAPLAGAAVWIVDDDGGPGVHFTDLNAAVAAAAAGDTILVAPGTYASGSVFIDKPLRILGTGADPYDVYLLAAPPIVEVRNVAGSDPVVLSNVSGASRMEVWDCDAPVVLIDVALAVRAYASRDVRLHGMQGPVYSPLDAFALSGSRLEAVGCDFQGSAGSPANCVGGGGTGGPGLAVGASRAHLSACTSTGGPGGYLGCSTSFGYGGDGGSGISMQSSTLVLAGAPDSFVAGGDGGGAFSGFCSFVGYGGTGLSASNSVILYSSTAFQGGPPGAPCTSSSLAGAATSLSGTGGLLPVSPAQPRLELLGTPGPGATVTLRTHAPAGADVTVFLGRTAIVQPEPGIEVEQLCDRLRAYHLGQVPVGKTVDHVVLLPAWMTPGDCLFAQAQVRLRTGERFNTNSIPIVAR